MTKIEALKVIQAENRIIEYMKIQMKKELQKEREKQKLEARRLWCGGLRLE